MDQFFLNYRQSSISIYKTGHGAKKLLCLHGYGETGKTFHCIAPHLENDYTIYAIDMPYHGQTEWKEGDLFEPDSLLELIQQLGIMDTEKITLLAYSMGGRVALHLLQIIPQKIEKMVLVAPDGMRMNFWYWLGTQTAMGNSIFKHTMQNPIWFQGLLRALVTVKFIDKWVARFTNQFLNNKQEREKLYKVWTTMRRFKPNLKKGSAEIKSFQIPLHLFYGKFDKVIQSKYGEKFQSQVSNHCTLKIIDTGHQLLTAEHAPIIANAFKS